MKGIVFTEFNRMVETQFSPQLLGNHIHVEVHSLFPDAELPKFSSDDPAPSFLVIIYESSRGLSTLACGLMQSVLKYYNETITIKADHISGNSHVRFRWSMT
jgi:hypothetical protein